MPAIIKNPKLMSELGLTDSPELYPYCDHSEPYRGKVFAMATERVFLPPRPGAAPSEKAVRRDYLSHPGAVAIVALRDWRAQDPQICLIRQYRHPIGAYLWEIPAGLRDVSGESPLATAQRELWEETDQNAQQWDVLVDTFTSGGCSTEAIRIFLAREVSAAREKAQREEEEALLEVEWVPLSAAVDAIYAGKIHACSSVQGVLATAYLVATNGWNRLRAADSEWFLGAHSQARFNPEA